MDNEELLRRLASLEDAVKATKPKTAITHLIPVIIALLTVGVSGFLSIRQLERIDRQIESSNGIETAKLISAFAEDIIAGGTRKELARIAFESVPLSAAQDEQFSRFLEDAEDLEQNPLQTAQDKDLETLIAALFSPNKQLRELSYSDAKSYIQSNISEETLDTIFRAIEADPFNINGRSNMLSILAHVKDEALKPHEILVDRELRRIINLKDVSPAYAIGPQTEKWVSLILGKYS